MRRIPVAVALVVLVLIRAPLAEGQLSREQIQQNRERLAAHFVSVHGSVAPEAIPYALRMAGAARRLEHRRADLGAEAFTREIGARFGGTPAQQHALDEGIRQRSNVRLALDQRQMSQLAGVCRSLLAGAISTREVAEQVDALRDEWLATLEAHYRAVMDSTGPQVRVRFMAYVDTEVVPNTGYGAVNHVGWANEFPEVYGRFITERCEHSDEWPSVSETIEPLSIAQ